MSGEPEMDFGDALEWLRRQPAGKAIVKNARARREGHFINLSEAKNPEELWKTVGKISELTDMIIDIEGEG